jgi:hypothetical protein
MMVNNIRSKLLVKRLLDPENYHTVVKDGFYDNLCQFFLLCCEKLCFLTIF